MLIHKEAREIIKQRAALHLEDPTIYRYWEKLTDVLSKDVDETIRFLETCSQEEVEYVSEVFEDISYRIQSKEYIRCLERLNKKYPNANLIDDIREAKDCMY